MSFQSILLNVRSMRRSMSIRDEADPEKVADILEQVVKESIHLQNAGDKGFQKKSMEELRQIRRDLVSGQINAGAKTDQMVGVYSSVIDAIDSMEKKTAEQSSSYKDTANALKKSIPSTDTLISALMTANPLVGYGVKMVRDLTRSGAERRKAEKAEAMKRLAILREQEKYLTEQFKQLDDNETPGQDKGNQNPVKEKLTPVETDGKGTTTDPDVVVNVDTPNEKPSKSTGRKGIYDSVLTEIRDEIRKLESYWAPTDTTRVDAANDPKFEQNGKVVDELTRVTTAIEDLGAQSVENTKDLIRADEELEDRRDRDDKLERMKDTSTNNNPVPLLDQVTSKNKTDPDKEGGLFSGIMGGAMRALAGVVMGVVGGFSGILAAFAAGGVLSTMLKPFSAVIKFIGGIGRLAMNLGTKVLLPIAVIKSIYDFFDAFFNADQFLKKNDSQISIKERISLGFANVLAKLTEMIDYVLNLFGLDLIDTEGLTVKIHEFFMGFPKMVTDMIEWLQTTTVDMYNSAIASVTEKYKDIKTSVVETFNKLVDDVFGIFNSLSDTFTSVITSIENKLSDWKRSLSNVPGIGSLFKSDDENKIQIDQAAMAKASQDLKDMTSSTNLLRLNEGVATMIPLESQSTAASQGFQRAEQQVAAPTQIPMQVNAPKTTVNNINQGGGAQSTNTGNPHAKFRRVAGSGYSGT